MTNTAELTHSIIDLPEPIQITKRHSGGIWFDQVIGNGRKIRYYSEPKCNVCSASPEVLRQVHVLAAMCQTAAAILRQVKEESEDGTAPFSLKSLRSHLHKHVPEYERFGRAVDAASIEMGGGIGARSVAFEALSQVVVNKGMALLVNDAIDLKMSDVLAASRFLYEMERNREDQGDARAYREALSAVILEVRASMSPERFRDFMFNLRTNPSMAEILSDGAPRVIEATAHESDGDADEMPQQAPLGAILQTL